MVRTFMLAVSLLRVKSNPYSIHKNTHEGLGFNCFPSFLCYDYLAIRKKLAEKERPFLHPSQPGIAPQRNL